MPPEQLLPVRLTEAYSPLPVAPTEGRASGGITPGALGLHGPWAQRGLQPALSFGGLCVAGRDVHVPPIYVLDAHCVLGPM